MMKTILISIALLLSAMSLTAQTSAEAKRDVAEIRKLYAAAKQEMEGLDQLEREGQPPGKTVFSSNYNEPGTGATKEVITYYHRATYDEETDLMFQQPFFITRSFNVAAREFYQEFMYDKEGSLKFFFEKSPDGETRYYFCSDDVYDIVKGTVTIDNVFARRLSSELTDAFNIVRNRNWD